MTISPGTRVGVYEIIGPLGKGGMGEVWRARDTRLGREVAIKTLPPDVASNPDRMARFEREAKLLASLHHANIGGIHGLEDTAPAGQEGQTSPIALVLELVEGDTLADRLQRGPIDVAEALKLAVQICAALEAAHDAGVIHRDLKPANIKVTPDGVVKVLDFGLAKAFTGSNDIAAVSHSPTISLAATQAGIILGTAAYMSPEQASGSASDTRADIWSFGVVLFEMLTGRAVFGGETISHVLAAVLATDPPWATLPANLHPRLREVLGRCLAKKASDRYRHIGDVRADLERVLTDPQGTTATPVAVATSGIGPRAALPWIAAALALGVVVASVVAWSVWPSPALRPVMRSSFLLPDSQTFSRPEVPLMTISHDGTRLAYVANSQIYVRNLNELDARPVPGTEDRSSLGPGSPAFSPDGQSLVYVKYLSPSKAEVKRVPVTGGTPVTLFDGSPSGLSWPEPDTLLLTTQQGIVRLPATGGAPQILIARGKDEAFDSPQILPGGRQVLFTRTGRPPGPAAYREDTQIVVQSVGSDDRRVVWEGAVGGSYLPTGHLVYVQGATMFAVPFDAATATVHGAPVPIVEGVRRALGGFTAAVNYAFSETGSLVFVPGTLAPTVNKTVLVWVDRNGREEALPIRSGDYTMARISPDGATIALVVGYGLQRGARPPSIWLFGLRTGNLSLLTGDPAGDDGPVWSSDGHRLFFRSFRSGGLGVYSIDIASGATELVAPSSTDFPFPLPWSVSPGTNSLALINATTLVDTNIAMLSLAGGGKLEHLLHDPALSENEPSISPDGAWMAYQQGTSPTAQAEINIRPFPGVMRTRIPLGPGREPVFSRDGSELFFFDGDGVSTAPVSRKPEFGIGQPRQLFKIGSRLQGAGREWDVDPSGKRFLLIRRAESETNSQAPRARIEIVLNWAEELKTRVPVK